MTYGSFTSLLPTVAHVDLNSCFATIEQQANPLLRGKPIVVAAYTTGNGCILAASREAKVLGINTGMPVREARCIYPRVIVLPSDPKKYRFINYKLQKLLGSYTPHLSIESIDEMVMNVSGLPALNPDNCENIMMNMGREIKQRIKREIGDWLTVSIGISVNRYLAKVASGLHKPDGLDMITKDTIEPIFSTMKLTDLCGIKEGNSRRLHTVGITRPVEFYRAKPETLVKAFHSKIGWQWWLRLHGYEDGVIYRSFEDQERLQKTFGQSYALAKFRLPTDPQVGKILTQLIVKMGRRLRSDGFTAHGFNVSCLYTDNSYWNKNHLRTEPVFADSDFLHSGRLLLQLAPVKPIRIFAVTSFDLEVEGTGQLPLWDTNGEKRNIVQALDTIADRWGEFTVTPASMLGMEHRVLDRIAFGGGRGLRKQLANFSDKHTILNRR